MNSPGVAVGRETLPGLDTAAADRKHSSAAAIQTRQEIFSSDLCRLSAVVSFLQDLCDALFTRLLSCHHTRYNITQPLKILFQNDSLLHSCLFRSTHDINTIFIISVEEL